MEGAMEATDSAVEFGSHELLEGAYATENTLHSSVAFLRNTLAGMGFCQDLNLLSTEPADVVSTCNTIYGLLLQHQKDCKFREQLKQEMHRLRLDMAAADREKARLEGRLAAKEREIGSLTNKTRATDEQRRDDVKAAKKEADELAKKVAGCEKRIVMLQHEIKRKEKDYERLQERLAHYLNDKKKSERSVLEMAGKLTQQLQSGQPTARLAGARSDEGLKAVVAAYEQKQQELLKENKDLKVAMASLQAEYKEVLNRQVRQQQDASSSSPEDGQDSAFLQTMSSMSEEELLAELSARSRALTRRLGNLSAASTPRTDGSAPEKGSAEHMLIQDLETTQGIIKEQERLLAAAIASMKTQQQAKEQQHQADMRRMAQHYQAQLAAAEEEIQRAKETQAEAAQSEVDLLSEQLLEVKAVLQQRLDAATAAEAAAVAEREAVQRQLAEARAAAAEAAARAEAAAEERGRLAAAVEAERRALAERQEAAEAAAQRFDLLKTNYEGLMRKYAPGIGAGILLERAISRKASEMTELALQDSAVQPDTIPAALG